ncbi:MAG: DUF4236 domain-containing protein [Lachnospiraceae bacterium]|nr:DUF4236 domain-containing protein [Lachnospiraceae bacterium]
MGLTFRKSITLLKGVKLNLGKKSASISVGRKGIHQSFSTTGRTTTSLSIPGTGVGYTKSFNMKKGFASLFGKKDEKEEKKGKEAAKAKENAKAAAAGTKEKEAAKGPSEEDKKLYESYVEQITLMRAIHKQADEPIDWQEVFDRPEPAGSALSSLRSDTKQSHEEWQELHDIAEKVLAGDIDTYLLLIDEMRPFDDILEYGSDFEVGTDDPSYLEVEFHVRSADVVPQRELILDEKGLKEKDLSKTAYYEMLQDYVCSCMLRVARDSFALLPIRRVVIHAVDTVLNTATGKEEEQTLVSVSVGRDQLDGVDFDRLDPSDALSAFPIKMDFKKTKGFSPVERIG